MVASRRILLVSMVLVGPLLWWSGVNDTASAAHAALRPGDSSLAYFVSNYRSGGLTMVAAFAFINLVLIMAVVPSARELRRSGIGTVVHAVIAAVLITGLAGFEYWLNPVTQNWSGDPDAWSLVKDHLASWYPPVGTFWMILNTAVAVLIAGRAMTNRRAD